MELLSWDGTRSTSLCFRCQYCPIVRLRDGNVDSLRRSARTRNCPARSLPASSNCGLIRSLFRMPHLSCPDIRISSALATHRFPPVSDPHGVLTGHSPFQRSNSWMSRISSSNSFLHFGLTTRDFAISLHVPRCDVGNAPQKPEAHPLITRSLCSGEDLRASTCTRRISETCWICPLQVYYSLLSIPYLLITILSSDNVESRSALIREEGSTNVRKRTEPRAI